MHRHEKAALVRWGQLLHQMAGPGKVRSAASSKVALLTQQALARFAAPTQHAPSNLTPSTQSVPSTNATTTQAVPSTNATTTQAAPSTNEATTQAALSTISLRTRSTQVRGQTRGKNIARLIAKNGGKKLPVGVPTDAKVPVGPYATPFANEVGLQIRIAAPIIGVSKWDKIDEIHKASIIQAEIEMQNKRFEEIENFMRMYKDRANKQVGEEDCSSEEFY